MPSTIQRLSIPMQTMYAELVDRAWAGDTSELLAAGGSPYAREVNGRRYWYWQPAGGAAGRPSAMYLGPDNEQVRSRIGVLRDLAAVKAERVALVRALRAARVPAPDGLTGNVLAALSAAGAFRLRGVVVGSVAFQAYGPLLGARFDAGLSRTGDLDIAQFHSIAVAVDDALEHDFLDVLRSVDRRFEAVRYAMDTRVVLRYAVRVGKQEIYSVDVLSPLRGAGRPKVTYLRALRANAQLLRYLDFLMYGEINAVVLHGIGVPVNVPAPERYGLHKLLVAQMRNTEPASQAKARKDLAQAVALIRVLAVDRPTELAEAWAELRGRGEKWRAKADRSLARLPPDVRSELAVVLRPDVGAAGATIPRS